MHTCKWPVSSFHKLTSLTFCPSEVNESNFVACYAEMAYKSSFLFYNRLIPALFLEAGSVSGVTLFFTQGMPFLKFILQLCSIRAENTSNSAWCEFIFSVKMRKLDKSFLIRDCDVIVPCIFRWMQPQQGDMAFLRLTFWHKTFDIQIYDAMQENWLFFLNMPPLNECVTSFGQYFLHWSMLDLEIQFEASVFAWLLHLLGDIDAQAKLLSPPNVEAQTVVIWGGVKVDNPSEGAAWAGLRRCAPTLLHHHTPVYQVHPEKSPDWLQHQQLETEIIHFRDLSKCESSPGSLLLGIADAGDFPNSPHYHPQPVISCQDFNSAAHGDALQADAIHLHQLVTYLQARLLCQQAQNQECDGHTVTKLIIR